MSDFRDYLNEQLKDPEFAAEYEALRPEGEYISAMLEARYKLNLTQDQLAERAGIPTDEITRIEFGETSPTIATLQKIAMALGKSVHIEFE